MCLHYPESLRGNPTFPLFLGYDRNILTTLVNRNGWSQSLGPSFVEREIYCNDKVTRSGVFRTTNRSDNWKVYMESYGYISKNIPHWQRNLLQVVVAWRNYTPSETDGYCLLWKTSQKAIGLPISFWVATVAGQNLATVAIVVELPSIAVL